MWYRLLPPLTRPSIHPWSARLSWLDISVRMAISFREKEDGSESRSISSPKPNRSREADVSAFDRPAHIAGVGTVANADMMSFSFADRIT